MIFDKFKGISREREIEAKEESKIELLLKAGDNFVKENNDMFISFERKEKYEELKNNALACCKFDENDLKYFIYAVQARDYNSEKEKELRGVYSGCLLQLLTERNRDAGKGTRFHMDGKGMDFPYLFSCAGNVDELVVENFKGNRICNFLGSGNGSVGLALGKNIEGDYVFHSIGDSCGSDAKASIGLVVCTGIKGDIALWNVGNSSKTSLVLASGIKGNAALSSVGALGDAGLVIGRDIEGKDPFNGIGSFGRINTLICSNIKGKGKSSFDLEQGCIDLVLAKDIEHEIEEDKSPSAKLGFGEKVKFESRIKLLLYEKMKNGHHVFGNNIGKKICSELSEEKYSAALQEYKLNEILELSNMAGKSTEQIISDAYKIRDIYDSIKGKLEK